MTDGTLLYRLATCLENDNLALKKKINVYVLFLGGSIILSSLGTVLIMHEKDYSDITIYRVFDFFVIISYAKCFIM